MRAPTARIPTRIPKARTIGGPNGPVNRLVGPFLCSGREFRTPSVQSADGHRMSSPLVHPIRAYDGPPSRSHVAGRRSRDVADLADQAPFRPGRCPWLILEQRIHDPLPLERSRAGERFRVPCQVERVVSVDHHEQPAFVPEDRRPGRTCGTTVGDDFRPDARVVSIVRCGGVRIVNQSRRQTEPSMTVSLGHGLPPRAITMGPRAGWRGACPMAVRSRPAQVPRTRHTMGRSSDG